jgi:pectate lyase
MPKIKVAAKTTANFAACGWFLRTTTAVALLTSACSGGAAGPTGSGGRSVVGTGGSLTGGNGAGGIGPTAGTGGGLSTGGGSGTGGATTATGGQVGSSGGATATGGRTGLGGGPGAAGHAGAAGNTGTGGVTGVGGGAAGGKTATGGSTGSAGTTGTAGKTGTGGATGTGGSTGAGGSTAATVQLIGFATLNGGTTGGKGATTVTASTYDQLKMYGESATAYIIMVQGTISNGANGGKISVKSNKSIIGVGSTAFLFGVGIDINNANNIIVQNLRVSMTGVTTRTDMAGVYSSTGDEGMPQILVNGGDAISISGTSKNVWIDHCEIFSEDPAVQTNKDLYDGLIDIKGQTGFITISWCYLHDQHKGGLVGASDTDLYADRKITYHHNYYNKVKLRVPMYRGAVGHFFNNYIVGATDASEIRADTCIRIEKNYYEALHYSIYTSSDSPGNAERIDNVEVSRTSRAYPTACTADIPYSYAAALTAQTNDVKTMVPPLAGVGKI